MTKRTPEEVHADGGHDERTVKSCSLCNPADAETGPELEFTEEPDPDAEPLAEVDSADYPEDSVPLPAERLEYVSGRVKCYLDACPLPEFADGTGLCGGHWSTRPDLRKAASHG